MTEACLQPRKPTTKRKRWSSFETQALKRLLKEKRFKQRLAGTGPNKGSKQSPLAATDTTIWQQLSEAALASGVHRYPKQIRDKYRDELSPAIIPWRSPSCWFTFNQLLPAHFDNTNKWVAIHHAWIKAEGKAPSVRDLKNNWGKVKRAAEKGVVPKSLEGIWPLCQQIVSLASRSLTADQQTSLESSSMPCSSDDEAESKQKIAVKRESSCGHRPLSLTLSRERAPDDSDASSSQEKADLDQSETETEEGGSHMTSDSFSTEFQRDDALEGIWDDSIPLLLEEFLFGEG
mmetsp:Transcript_10066/g.28890  ORF Transcript_10066/g.28890 Transcript_10066/m.28890 type:complete len:290 (-) Transcript_10066:381-1250(-)